MDINEKKSIAYKLLGKYFVASSSLFHLDPKNKEKSFDSSCYIMAMDKDYGTLELIWNGGDLVFPDCIDNLKELSSQIGNKIFIYSGSKVNNSVFNGNPFPYNYPDYIVCEKGGFKDHAFKLRPTKLTLDSYDLKGLSEKEIDEIKKNND